MINLLKEVKCNQYLFPTSLNEIDEMSGEEFEDFLFWYYKKAGYEVKKTPKINDSGIDLIVRFFNEETNKEESIGVQAKRWSSKVPKEQIVKMSEAKDFYELNYLFLITTSKLTSEANLYAQNHDIRIKDRNTILEMLDDLKTMNNISFRKSSNVYEEDKENLHLDINLYNKLKKYRMLKAKNIKKPAYIIFNNNTLCELATFKPTTIHELKNINGFGENKISLYGEEILKLINE